MFAHVRTPLQEVTAEPSTRSSPFWLKQAPHTLPQVHGVKPSEESISHPPPRAARLFQIYFSRCAGYPWWSFVLALRVPRGFTQLIFAAARVPRGSRCSSPRKLSEDAPVSYSPPRGVPVVVLPSRLAGSPRFRSTRHCCRAGAPW